MRRFLVMLAVLVLMAPAAPPAPVKTACAAACCHQPDTMAAPDRQEQACCRLAPKPPRDPARPVDTRQAADGVAPRVIGALSPVDTWRGAPASPSLSDRDIRHMRLMVIRI